MPGKLEKNLKIRVAHRLNTRKVFASVDELLMDYEGCDTTKDKIKRITITLNEKLATLKALDAPIFWPNRRRKFRTGDRGILRVSRANSWRPCQVA